MGAIGTVTESWEGEPDSCGSFPWRNKPIPRSGQEGKSKPYQMSPQTACAIRTVSNATRHSSLWAFGTSLNLAAIISAATCQERFDRVSTSAVILICIPGTSHAIASWTEILVVLPFGESVTEPSHCSIVEHWKPYAVTQ